MDAEMLDAAADSTVTAQALGAGNGVVGESIAHEDFSSIIPVKLKVRLSLLAQVPASEAATRSGCGAPFLVVKMVTEFFRVPPVPIAPSTPVP